MANKLTLEVEIVQKGGKQVIQLVQGVGAATAKATKATQQHTTATQINNQTQAKGVAGTANSTKNFSKLAETIGSGGGGLVGAYATLAANIFAVSAAFNALRNASQVQQVLAGIEAMGARTGRTITLAANSIKELTNGAISSEQALRSTAQVFAAGFGQKELEDLTQVALDASSALGRNLTDSMDRITRGVIKLEPELLDELGLMTRLDEATQAYAITLGKNASQLTATEKRIGFLNAIVEEGTLKMGGLAESGDQFKSFDRLAATFSDLTNKVIGFIAKAITPLVELIAGNMGVMTGLLIMFAGTISRDLLPGLNGLASKAKESADALAKQSVATAQTIKTIKGGPQVFNDLQKKIQDGTATTNEYARAQLSLQRSIEATQRAQQKAMAAGQPVAAGSDARIIEAQKAQKAIADVVRTQNQAVAASQAATAVELASQGKIVEAYRERAKAVAAFTAAESAANNRVITSLGRLRIAAFGAATAVRVLGAAFLYAIPIIGQVALAVSLLGAAYEYLKKIFTTKEQQEYNKVAEQFGEIIDALNEKTAAYIRTQNALGTGSQRQIQLFTIESNAITEIVTKYEELREAAKKAEKSSLDLGNSLSTNIGKALLFGPGGLLIEKGIKELDKKITGIGGDSQLYEFRYKLMAVSGTEEFKAYQTILESGMPTAIKALKKEFDITSEAALKMSPIEQQQRMEKAVLKVGAAMKAMSGVMVDIVNTFRELDNASSQFIRSTIITTPFDDVVQRGNAAKESLLELERAATMAGYGTDDVAAAVANLGSNFTKFLTPQIAQAIKDYNAYTAAAARSKAEGNMAEYEKSTKAAQAAAKVIYQFGIQDINLAFKRFELAQKSARLNAGEIEVLKARLAANKELYSTSVTGLQAQFDMEAQITKKEIEGLNIQKRAIDDILRSRTAFSAQNEQELAAAEARQARLQSEGKQVDQQTIETIQRLSSEKKTQADFLASQINLSNQILVKSISIKTQEEITAYLYERQLGLQNRVLQVKAEIARLSEEQNSTELAINRVLVGRPEFISDKLKELEIQERINKNQILFSREQERNSQRARRAIAIASLSRAITDLERKAALETISIIDQETALMEKQYDLRLKNAELTATQNKLSEVTFDSRVQGIEWQQQGLSLLEREIEARRNLAEQANELFTLQREISLQSKGLAFNENQQKAAAIEAAATAYKFAVEEASLKKDLITLEFSLLKAQREYLAIDLKTRRATIASSPEFKTAEQKAAQRGMIESIDRTLGILKADSTLFDRALNASLDSIDRNVEIQRAKLVAASNIIPTATTQVGKIMQSFDDAAALTKALANRNETLKTSIESISVVEKLEAAIPTAEIIGETMAAPVVAAINSALPELKSNSSSVYKDVASIGRELQRMGLRVSEHPEFGGVGKHTPGSSHYSGNAIDVNVGRGVNEYNNPAIRKQFEALAEKLMAQGAKVLFGPAFSKYNNSRYDHTDHMHVTFRPEDAKVAGHQIAMSFNENVEDIVVTAPVKSSIDTSYVQSLIPDLQNFNTLGLEQKIETAKTVLNPFVEQLKGLGPEGELVSSAITGIYSIQSSIFRLGEVMNTEFKTSGERVANTISAGLDVAQSAASTINGIVQQQASIKAAAIDREIEAEKRRDGRSAESVARIAALEKKKDQVQKKAFETNKKMMAAQAVMSTASGIAMALGTYPPPASFVLAGAIAAMGAAQLAVIASSKYEGSGAQATSVATPSTLSIGTRSNAVDTARTNVNAGGEYGYVSGARGFGTNAANFQTIGSAYGGEYGRGYGNNAFAIGEKGPEILTRDTPVEITPMEDFKTEKPMNVNLTIQALDSSGVEEILFRNRGALIQTIRDAANSSGKTFLEDVNVANLRGTRL